MYFIFRLCTSTQSPYQ